MDRFSKVTLIGIAVAYLLILLTSSFPSAADLSLLLLIGMLASCAALAFAALFMGTRALWREKKRRRGYTQILLGLGLILAMALPGPFTAPMRFAATYLELLVVSPTLSNKLRPGAQPQVAVIMVPGWDLLTWSGYAYDESRLIKKPPGQRGPAWEKIAGKGQWNDPLISCWHAKRLIGHYYQWTACMRLES
jgi:MFS family permease